MATLSRKEMDVRHDMQEALMALEFPGNQKCVAATRLRAVIPKLSTKELSSLLLKSASGRMHSYRVLLAGLRIEKEKNLREVQRRLFEALENESCSPPNITGGTTAHDSQIAKTPIDNNLQV